MGPSIDTPLGGPGIQSYRILNEWTGVFTRVSTEPCPPSRVARYGPLTTARVSTKRKQSFRKHQDQNVFQKRHLLSTGSKHVLTKPSEFKAFGRSVGSLHGPLHPGPLHPGPEAKALTGGSSELPGGGWWFQERDWRERNFFDRITCLAANCRSVKPIERLTALSCTGSSSQKFVQIHS